MPRESTNSNSNKLQPSTLTEKCPNNTTFTFSVQKSSQVNTGSTVPNRKWPWPRVPKQLTCISNLFSNSFPTLYAIYKMQSQCGAFTLIFTVKPLLMAFYKTDHDWWAKRTHWQSNFIQKADDKSSSTVTRHVNNINLSFDYQHNQSN